MHVELVCAVIEKYFELDFLRKVTGHDADSTTPGSRASTVASPVIVDGTKH